MEQTQTELLAEEKTSGNEFLRVEHLKKYFVIEKSLLGKPLRYLKAVDDVSFTLERGKTIGVVGESGCGKTTLGRTILKLYEPDGGKIFFEGQEITSLNKKNMRKFRTDMQLVFQDPYSSLPPRMTVGSLISEGVKVHKVVPKEQMHDYVMDIMQKCGLQPQYYDRYPHEFSGGQRQRICIARALAVKPKLVICDEPVSALDVSIQAQIINLLKELQNDMGLTYVFISHDLSVVKYITDSVLVMYLGNMMEKGDTDEIFNNPLHPYTKALFSAVPVPNPDVKMNRIILQGDIPSPANPPKGCKFHTRCSSCMNVCKFVDPKYAEVSPNHFVACHLYDSEIMSNLSEYDARWEELERQRIAEEEAKKLKKKHSAEQQETPEKAEDAALETPEEVLAEEETAADTYEDAVKEEELAATIDSAEQEEEQDFEQDDESDDIEDEDEEEDESAVGPDGSGVLPPFAGGRLRIRSKYNKSFTAKLMLSPDNIKQYYCEVANELLAYKKVTYRMHWKQSSLRAGMKTLAKFTIRGATLCLYLALDPQEYQHTKYAAKDMSAVKRYAAVPVRVKIKSPRGVRYAKELMHKLAEKNNLVTARVQKTVLDASEFPTDTIENLVQKGYIKQNPDAL